MNLSELTDDEIERHAHRAITPEFLEWLKRKKDTIKRNAHRNKPLSSAEFGWVTGTSEAAEKMFSEAEALLERKLNPETTHVS